MQEIWKTTEWDYIEISNLGHARTKDAVRPFPFYDRHHKTFKTTLRLIKAHTISIQENNKGVNNETACYVAFGG